MSLARKLALALVAVALLLAAAITVLRPASKAPVDVAAPAERPAVRRSLGTSNEEVRRVSRARWEERRARIRAAQAPRARDDAPRAYGAPSPGCADASCSSDAAEHGSDAVFSAFVEETTTLTQGCEELLGGKPTSVRITARLIGAPEVGTIVESVDVSGPVGHMDALTECLTEGMYTLELGDTAASFERDAVLTLGLLDEVAGEGWLTATQVAEIRQQLLDGGLDPAKDPMVAVAADEPPSTR